MAHRPVAALVGRAAGMDVLVDRLRAASQGHPGFVIVSGETGVGKTRLVGELLRRERPHALVGACVPVAGVALPFAALAQGLRRMQSGSGNRYVQTYPDLVRLIASGAEPAPEVHDGVGQLPLFQSVLSLLGDLGRIRPVVHVVEDIHWADRSCLDLLRFLATNLVDERALIVLTYRTEELAGESAIQSWLAEMRRLPRVDDLPLDRLGRAETESLVQGLGDGRLDPALAESIVLRSGGNPLFTQHLVWHADEDGEQLPEVLGDLLRSRLAQLPKATRDVVRAASVLARRVPIDLLAATCGRDQGEIEADLQPALERQVLTVTRRDSVGFGHPAFREVAYVELWPSQRAALHRAAATALQDRDSEGADPGELARHWHLAGDLPRALGSALQAGYAAERLPAHADARINFRRVLELTDRSRRRPVEGADAVDRADVLRRAARASRLLGEDAEAVLLLTEAIADEHDDHRRAAVFEELGYVEFMAGRGPEAQAALQQALALLPTEEVSELAAKVHAGLGLLAAAWSHPDEADAACARALQLSEAIGAHREAGRARGALGLVAAARGDFDAAVQQLQAALEAAHAAANPDDLAVAYINLTHVLGVAERNAEAAEVAGAGIDTLTRLGLAQQAGSLLMANGAEALFELGRYGESAAFVERSMQVHPRGIMAVPGLLRAAQLATVAGDLDTASTQCRAARRIIAAAGPLTWILEVAVVAGDVELWAGRPAAALEMLESALASDEGIPDEGLRARLACLGFRALADLADARRTIGDRADQAALMERLDEMMPCTSPATGELAACQATARAERARIDRSDVPADWARSRESWAALSRPLEMVYARWRAAEAALRRGVDGPAIEALRAADAEARALTVVPIVAEVANLARWYRVDLLSPASPAPAGTGDGTDQDALADYGLTPREREVLGGLSAGLTNLEIGTSLGMSVKTASVHVSSILRKMQVDGRQEAARVAHRLGVGAH